jgi:peptidoglycan-N-acetylglucosamine deacetylase
VKNTSIKHRIKQGLSRLFPDYLIVDSGKTGLSAITFDDGPCPGNTERILNVLEKNNIKATFFLSGEEAEKSPGLIKLIHSKGHQLANHGYFHKKSHELGKSEYVSGVIRTHALLESAVGEKIKKVFRPPFGELNISAGISLLKQGFQYAMWSYDTRDSYVDTDTQILEHLRNDKPREAEIFLMHEDYPHLASALPDLIKILKKDGHSFVRLDEI